MRPGATDFRPQSVAVCRRIVRCKPFPNYVVISHYMTAITEDGQITKEVIREGAGPCLVAGDEVKVHYIASIRDSGVVFDDSRSRGTPYRFTVGKGDIKAWSLGIVSMKVGETARFTVGADYVYGARGMGPDVPADSTVVIEAELLEIMESFDSVESAAARAEELNVSAAAEFRAGRLAEAIALYERQIEVVDTYVCDAAATVRVRANRNLALLHGRLGDLRSSLLHADLVLAGDAKDVKAIVRKVEAHIGLEHTAEARRAIGDATKAVFAHLVRRIEEAERALRRRADESFERVLAKK